MLTDLALIFGALMILRSFGKGVSEKVAHQCKIMKAIIVASILAFSLARAFVTVNFVHFERFGARVLKTVIDPTLELDLAKNSEATMGNLLDCYQSTILPSVVYFAMQYRVLEYMKSSLVSAGPQEVGVDESENGVEKRNDKPESPQLQTLRIIGRVFLVQLLVFVGLVVFLPQAARLTFPYAIGTIGRYTVMYEYLLYTHFIFFTSPIVYRSFHPLDGVSRRAFVVSQMVILTGLAALVLNVLGSVFAFDLLMVYVYKVYHMVNLEKVDRFARNVQIAGVNPLSDRIGNYLADRTFSLVKEGWSKEETLEFLQSQAGKRFDALVHMSKAALFFALVLIPILLPATLTRLHRSIRLKV